MSFLLFSDEWARRHRRNKRHAEIVRIVKEISSLHRPPHLGTIRPLILEYGCGNGFQIPYLQAIGDVVATDIYTSDEIRRMPQKTFCESSITALPFGDRTFDIIFSNHVVEHLPDPAGAFAELRRVAQPGCLFAFSVPTNYWLLLALPSKYLGKLATLTSMLAGKLILSSTENDQPSSDVAVRMARESDLRNHKPHMTRWLQFMLPKGHGVYDVFSECYKAFRIGAWHEFFLQNGFSVEKVVPLLLYGPSEFPVIPTTERLIDKGICSSVLFLMTAGADALVSAEAAVERNKSI